MTTSDVLVEVEESRVGDRLAAPRELAARRAHGLEVGLFWNGHEDRLWVSVIDSQASEAFQFEVASSEAMDAFHHPYAHAARRGISFRASSLPEPEAG